MGNPGAEISGEVNDLHSFDCASSMLFVHELSYEIIADQRCKISIAYSCVLSLGNVNVFLLFLFLFLLWLLFPWFYFV